jgi:microsomal dipeptidase-like Zn-dependent dipeptidase
MNPFVVDIHCDLLSYIQDAPNPNPLEKNSIGCSFPSLEEGNVKLQVMAIYTSTEKGSTELGLQQSLIFKNLLNKYSDRIILSNEPNVLSTISKSPKLGILAAIENASGFCEEDEPLKDGIKKLENIIYNTERILYIGLTHHSENRFGGGNGSKVGLKEDGKTLLNYINGKKIAVDFSHTSDALALDILDYLSKNNLDIPVIASHSNFRKIFNHPRNLPDEIANEIIKRKGLIGINFLRAFLNDQNPNAFYDHILYGINLGGTHSICFGADYFYTDSHPDQSRKPFFFKEHESASCYPSILKNLSERVSPEVLECISNKNVVDFIGRIWS